MQELRKKNSPKNFFHVGENLCFGIFEFLEINFRRWFFTWLHFWQCLGHFGAYSPLYTAALILCWHVDITKIVLPRPASLLLTFFRFWARAKKTFSPREIRTHHHSTGVTPCTTQPSRQAYWRRPYMSTRISPNNRGILVVNWVKLL